MEFQGGDRLRLLALDTGPATCSISSEIVARATMECFESLTQAPRRLALPDFPAPTSPALKEAYYRRAEDILSAVGEMLGKEVPVDALAEARTCPLDVPGDWFKGPF